MKAELNIDLALESIRKASKQTSADRSLLVAVSGIDGSGKGYVTARLVGALKDSGLNAVGINIDGWLSLPEVRFSAIDPAQHFYQHAIRFDEMFDDVVLPLRDKRSVCVEVNHADETAVEYRRQRYDFRDVEVIVLEGIYLLKREFLRHYDLSFWVECGFETALQRAIARGQEGLAGEETARAYRTIYFPAQEIHFERDHPKAAATGVIYNDV